MALSVDLPVVGPDPEGCGGGGDVVLSTSPQRVVIVESGFLTSPLPEAVATKWASPVVRAAVRRLSWKERSTKAEENRKEDLCKVKAKAARAGIERVAEAARRRDAAAETRRAKLAQKERKRALACALKGAPGRNACGGGGGRSRGGSGRRWKRHTASAAFANSVAAKRIQRAWRRFKPTTALASAAISANIAPQKVESDALDGAFDAMAARLNDPSAVRFAGCALRRAEAMCARRGLAPSPHAQALLASLANKKKKSTGAVKQDRFPARVALCATMIASHPEMVVSRHGGPREAALIASAEVFADALHNTLLPAMRSGREMHAALIEFETAWEPYLDAFVSWRGADAAVLEAEIVRIATELHFSVFRKCGTDRSVPLSHDKEAMVEQLQIDRTLLREKILQLGGAPAGDRFDARLTAVRAEVEAEEVVAAAADEEWRVNGQSSARSPGAARPTASALEADADERLCWELLHNPAYRLPEVEADDATLDEQANMPTDAATEAEAREQIAASVGAQMHRAFWDRVEAGLRQNPPDTTHAMALLHELRTDVTDTLTEGRADAILAALDPAALEAATSLAHTDPRGALLRLREMLDRATAAICAMGAPARDAEAEAARSHIIASVAEVDGAVAKGVARALRFLFHQLRVLKRDAANAHISRLAAMFGNGHGPNWCQKRFASRYNLPTNDDEMNSQTIVAALPRTANALKNAAAILAQNENQWANVPLEASNANADHPASTASSAVPEVMATGVRSPVGGLSSATSQAAPKEEQVAPHSWKGLLRISMVDLVTKTDSPLIEAGVPETLGMDCRRMHELQESIQCVRVTAACMLACKQFANTAGFTPRMGELTQRIAAVLADSTTRLTHVAAEVARAAGATGREDAVERMLAVLTDNSHGGGRSISRAVRSAMFAAAVHGAVDSKSVIVGLLTRVGCPELDGSVNAVAEKLVGVANVSAAVHAPWYSAIADIHLEDEI